MNSKHTSLDANDAPTSTDGFEVLDECHRLTLVTLGQLGDLADALTEAGPDAAMREAAAGIVAFFSTTARQHHEDEERHVFPKLLGSPDPEVVQTVLRLQQDHHWLEQNWLELGPLLDAVAAGQSWYDLDALREGVEIFAALSHDHVALEESLIYPQARTALGSGERREMGREMAARRAVEREANPAPDASKRRG
jgi:hemerythrin-like domain-containing protein